MDSPIRPFIPRLSYGNADRTIATARVALAVLSLFAVWLDPVGHTADITVTYGLYTGYVVYSVLIGAVVWSWRRPGWLPIVTHVTDLAIFSIFLYRIGSTPSPIYMSFVFVMFCAALRWGWIGTLRTMPIVVVLMVVMGSSISHGVVPTELELNRLLIRIGYLLMVGALLVYLGWYEASRRHEIQQLARWPADEGPTESDTVRTFLEYGTTLLGAEAAAAVWSITGEPGMSVARWSPSAFDLVARESAEIEQAGGESPGVDPPSAEGTVPDGVPTVMQRDSEAEPWPAPIPSALAPYLTGVTAGSAAFSTDRVSGRVFLSWHEHRTAEVLPLLESVTRHVGQSIDQMHGRIRQRRLAVGEERMRLARDLHDGVVQSLTGIRFELQSLWRALATEVPSATRDRLLAMERALAAEQREIRLFIEDLTPFARSTSTGSLTKRLHDVGERLSGQWHVPIHVRVDGLPSVLPPAVGHAVVPMVQEAVTNALKHGNPSKVCVTVQAGHDGLQLIVVDDGHGFGFEGEFDLNDLIARRLGPASLRDRVSSLGGRLAIKSSAAGARIEMALPYAVRS